MDLLIGGGGQRGPEPPFPEKKSSDCNQADLNRPTVRKKDLEAARFHLGGLGDPNQTANYKRVCIPIASSVLIIPFQKLLH